MTLTAKAIYFLKQLELIGQTNSKKEIKKKVSDPQDNMGPNFLNNVNEYRMLFPAGTLPTGAASRASVPELAGKFTKFFAVFPNHNWELILEATTRYVEKYAAEDYKFMKNSTNFISKRDLDGNTAYELASKIDMLDQEEIPTLQYYPTLSN